MNRQFEAAWRLHGHLGAQGIPYAIMGGIAVQRWGQPRLTRDVDLTILLPPGCEEPPLRALVAPFPPRIENAVAFALENRVLPVEVPGGSEADLSLGLPGYEEEVVARAVGYDLGGERLVRLCTAEDLLVHKALAGRPQDLKVIVIDPFLTNNPKTPPAHKNRGALGKVDMILVTHGHGDHTGDVAELAKRTGARVLGSGGLLNTMMELGWFPPAQALRSNEGGRVTPLGPQIIITQVPAEHSSALTVTDPTTRKNTTYPAGEPCGFIVELENGFKLYHMGDTGLFWARLPAATGPAGSPDVDRGVTNNAGETARLAVIARPAGGPPRPASSASRASPGRSTAPPSRDRRACGSR